MAIWQFDCMVIPEDRDKKNYIDIDKYISWIGINIPEDAFTFLSNHLPVEKSWSNVIKQYGKRDSTCIEIFLLGNEVEEIRCRFDLRNISKSLLINILEFINMIDGKMYFNDNTYDTNVKDVVEFMRNSDAARFCNNPIEYLQNLDITTS
jgi:hypothetical protein